MRGFTKQELGLRETAALRSTVFPYLESARAVAGPSFHVISRSTSFGSSCISRSLPTSLRLLSLLRLPSRPAPRTHSSFRHSVSMDQYFILSWMCSLESTGYPHPHAPCAFTLARYVAENTEVSSLWWHHCPCPFSVAMGYIYSPEALK